MTSYLIINLADIICEKELDKNIYLLGTIDLGVMPGWDTEAGKDWKKQSLKPIQKNLFCLVDLGKYKVVPGQLEKRIIVAKCKDALKK